VETVRSHRLPDRNHSASSTLCPLASSDVDALCCRHLSVSGCSEQVAETKTVAFIRSCLMSVDNCTLRCVDDMAAPREHMDSESSDSDILSWVSDTDDRSAGLPASAFNTPPSGQLTSGSRGARGGGRDAGGSTSVDPSRAKGAKYMLPTRHFPRQACQLCDEPRIFETRSSFSEHLKIHKYVWMKGTYCIPLQQAMGHMRGGYRPRRKPHSFSRGCGASPPRKAPSRAAYHSVPPPPFINWQREGAASQTDQTAPLADVKVPADNMGLPPPRIPQMAVTTSVQAFTPFSGPRPAKSSGQGSVAGQAKVEPLVDLPETGSLGRGRMVETTRRKNIWERLGGKASDPFGTIPQGELPPPLVMSPGSPPVATATSQVPRSEDYVWRGWTWTYLRGGSSPGTSSGGVLPIFPRGG